MKKFRLALIVVPLLLLLAAVTSLSASPMRQLISNDSNSVPSTITYQGVLSDSNGATVNDGPYSAVFSLYTTETGGSAVWEESHEVIVQDGLFSVELGKQKDLATALEKGPELFLGITIGSGRELTPRRPVTSVPFALSAKNAESLNGLDAQDIVDAAVGATVTDPCVLERQLATATDRHNAPIECLPLPTALSEESNSMTPSVDIRSDGRPVVAFADGNGLITIALCSNISCTEHIINKLKGEPAVAGDLAMQVDSLNRPMIAFQNAETGDLKLAARSNESCSNAVVTLVDAVPFPTLSAVNSGMWLDLSLTNDGLARIAYFQKRSGGGSQHRAICMDRACTEVQLRSGSSCSGCSAGELGANGLGQLASIVAASDGSPRMVSIDDEPTLVNANLILCGDPNCGDGTFGASPRSLDRDLLTISSTAITVSPEDFAVIAYTETDTIVYIVCGDANNCSASGQQQAEPLTTGFLFKSLVPPEPPNGTTHAPSLTGVSLDMLPGFEPFFAWIDLGVGVMVARCENIACDALPPVTRVGRNAIGGTDLAIGPDGTPVVVFLALDIEGQIKPHLFRCEDCSHW